MTNTLTISRELAERLAVPHADANGWTTWNTAVAYNAAKELRALLAAPVVERQEPVALITVTEIDREYPSSGRNVYVTWLDGSDKHLSTGDKLYTSPPAPIAVVLPDHEFRETVNRLRAISEMYGRTDQLRERISMELRACLDKVKEMNQ